MSRPLIIRNRADERGANPTPVAGSVEIDRQTPPPSSSPAKLSGLVLTRRPMESIRIGDEVTIDVVAIRRGQVRLRIVAPRRIPVHRLEIFEAIQAGEPRQAAPTSKADADASSTSEQPTGGLVLARTLGESLKIGQEVQVDVVQIQPNSVRLRIVAPRSITVHRMEVHQAIARGEQAPAASRSQRPSRNTDLESTAELPCLALDQPAPVE